MNHHETLSPKALYLIKGVGLSSRPTDTPPFRFLPRLSP